MKHGNCKAYNIYNNDNFILYIWDGMYVFNSKRGYKRVEKFRGIKV